jgi:hypothetical protein
MAIINHHTGGDWNQERYDKTIAVVIPDPSNLPSGLIAHLAGPGEGGSGWQVMEAWETQEAWESFLQGTLIPAAQELGMPPFETKTTELHNTLIA